MYIFFLKEFLCLFCWIWWRSYGLLLYIVNKESMNDSDAYDEFQEESVPLFVI